MNKAMVIMAFLLAAALTARAQGPLTPPGIPAPIMKTLDQIEPRTAITNLPFVINQSGSYYLTGNLDSTGHGLVVRADGVTVDLMGFRMTGNRSTPHRGVLVENNDSALPIRNVVIRNGHITDFYTGVWLEKALDCRIEVVTVTSNVLDGAQIRYGRGNVLENSVISRNGANGVYIYAFGNTSSYHTVQGCRIMNNEGHGVLAYTGVDGRVAGNRIRTTTISGNALNGITFSTDSFGKVIGNQIADVTIHQNGDYGIIADGSNLEFTGNIIARTHVTGHDAAGIRIRGEVPSLANQFLELSVQENGSHGIWVEQLVRGAIISASKIRGNSGHGIFLDTTGSILGTSGWVIHDCTIMDNIGAGVFALTDQGRTHANLFAGNNVSGNADGGLSFRSRNQGAMHGMLVRHNAIAGASPILFQADSEGEMGGSLITGNTLRGGLRGISMTAVDSGVVQGNAIEGNVFSDFEELGMYIIVNNNGVNRGHLIAGNQLSAPGAGLGKGMYVDAANGGVTEGLWIRENTIAVPHVANIHVAGDSARNLVTGNHLSTNTPLFITTGANVSYGPLARGSGEMGGGAMAHPWANLITEEP